MIISITLEPHHYRATDFCDPARAQAVCNLLNQPYTEAEVVSESGPLFQVFVRVHDADDALIHRAMSKSNPTFCRSRDRETGAGVCGPSPHVSFAT